MTKRASTRTVVWRGDLLHALAEGGDLGLAALVATLGMRERPAAPSSPDRVSESQSKPTEPSAVGRAGGGPLVPVPFWRVVGRRWIEPEPVSSHARPFTLDEFRDRRFAPAPPRPPLVRWSRLRPCLTDFCRTRVECGRVDVQRLVRDVSELRARRRLPRHRGRVPSARIFVLVDRSRHLEPFWADQREVLDHLQRRLGAVVIQVEWWPHGVTPVAEWEVRPDAGEPVLALSDLGAYAGATVAADWSRLATELERLEAPRLAVMPVPRDRVGAAPVRAWSALEWEAPSRPGALDGVSDRERRRRRRRALSRRLAPALELGDGLLRAARLLFAAERFDAGTEYDLFWERYGTAGADARSAARDLNGWRALLGADARAFVDLLRDWHSGGPAETWAEEIVLLGLDCESADLLQIGELDDARALLARVAANLTLEGVDREDLLRKALAGWFRDMARRHQGAWVDPELGPRLRAAWDSLDVRQAEHVTPPEALRTATSVDTSGAVSWLGCHHGESITFATGPRYGGVGAPIGDVVVHSALRVGTHGGSWGETLRPAESIAFVPPRAAVMWWRSDVDEVVLERVHRPEWADAIGRDRFGLWAEFSVKGVVQRMRWVPPGRFRMGSPEDEPGRYDDEGPRHEVRLTHGYWLADTPCTQELWEAVIGENPSRFVSAKRPVEQVSWEDVVSKFLPSLNEACGGLEARLPTEAEWENACRAGSEEATYAGAMEILGENHAPVLDGIAWYGGNSGVGFELEDGEDSSDWSQKQHDHDRAGTRIVGEKHPNQLGLYDMLGNVLEWCGDGRRDYTAEVVTDPVGRMGANRVIRGGSWDDDAGDVRAAYRDWYRPDGAYSSLGFRLSRGQASARGADGGAGAKGTPARARRDAGEGVADWLPGGRRPAWAQDVGRDRHGVWAVFVVDGVMQRMRWVPPRRFRMGSPEGEPGRIDREGPQHEVRLTQGYWLADTPCTQDLWEAVTGENPSRFVSRKRPVERVSWDAVVSEFLPRLNEECVGLEARLPTEAEWEHACRAGSEEATYAGAIEILGSNHAPVLDGIAWYGGNSGVDFDLEDGEDSSGWPEKQHDHDRAGTRIVGEKQPNELGLYDMLGNVWEWCGDGRREYTAEVAMDPVGPMGANRVIRGGSWGDDARDVRAACRNWVRPDDAGSNLGFRLSRGQESVLGAPGGAGSESRRASRRRDAGAGGGR